MRFSTILWLWLLTAFVMQVSAHCNKCDESEDCDDEYESPCHKCHDECESPCRKCNNKCESPCHKCHDECESSSNECDDECDSPCQEEKTTASARTTRISSGSSSGIPSSVTASTSGSSAFEATETASPLVPSGSPSVTPAVETASPSGSSAFQATGTASPFVPSGSPSVTPSVETASPSVPSTSRSTRTATSSSTSTSTSTKTTTTTTTPRLTTPKKPCSNTCMGVCDLDFECICSGHSQMVLPCDFYALCPEENCLKVMTDCCYNPPKAPICSKYVITNLLSYKSKNEPKKKMYTQAPKASRLAKCDPSPVTECCCENKDTGICTTRLLDSADVPCNNGTQKCAKRQMKCECLGPKKACKYADPNPLLNCAWK